MPFIAMPCHEPGLAALGVSCSMCRSAASFKEFVHRPSQPAVLAAQSCHASHGAACGT